MSQSRNKRFQVRGYQSTNQPQPDVIQEYDELKVAETHMYAMLDKQKANCQFAEVVDVDATLNIMGDAGLNVESERKFKTVRAVER